MLWQKERLLNLALKALPSSCHKVAWLDCDIFFTDPGGSRTRILCSIDTQSFSCSGRCTISARNGLLEKITHLRCNSRVRLRLSPCRRAFPPRQCIGHVIDNRIGTWSAGFAWAARRDVLDRHFFYDACMIGGGDSAIACAAHHCFDELMLRHCMNEHERQRYITWAKPYYETVRAETAFLNADIFHLGTAMWVNGKGAHDMRVFNVSSSIPTRILQLSENGCLAVEHG